ACFGSSLKDTGPVAPHSGQCTESARGLSSTSTTSSPLLAQNGQSNARTPAGVLSGDVICIRDVDCPRQPLIRRGSMPRLSLPATRPASFLITSSTRLLPASSRPLAIASDFLSCSESARCVASVCTAHRPSGRGSTDTCGLRGMASSLALLGYIDDGTCPARRPRYAGATRGATHESALLIRPDGRLASLLYAQ